MNDYKTRLLLACLAVLTARCGSAIVLTDADVEAALDNHTEVMYEHDHRAGCVERALPVYTIAHIDDLYGRIVAYERLLLPFSDGEGVSHVIASLKTISEDGGFEIRNLMRGNDALPTSKLRAVIDRDLFHRAPGRIPSGDLIEFS